MALIKPWVPTDSITANTSSHIGGKPKESTSNTISTGLVRARLLELRHVNSSDAEQMAQVEKQYAELQVRLAADKKFYEPLIISPEEQGLYNQFIKERERYLELSTQLLKFSHDGEKDKAKELADLALQRK